MRRGPRRLADTRGLRYAITVGYRWRWLRTCCWGWAATWLAWMHFGWPGVGVGGGVFVALALAPELGAVVVLTPPGLAE